MPTPAENDFSHFLSCDPDLDFLKRDHRCCASAPHSPSSSPISYSPKSCPPMSTLRRSLSSTFSLIPEEEEPKTAPKPRQSRLIFNLTFGLPLLLLNIIRKIVGTRFQPSLSQIFVILPTLWIAGWLWLFWKAVKFPLEILKWFLELIASQDKTKKRRTVIISNGSTIQALHLARNFYCSGFRIIITEFEGQFNLCKFSASVDKYYTVPKPSSNNSEQYIKALCEIASAEKANFYIPVCATSSAYYDAIAKPHLEAAGCVCFVPNLKEVTILDDIAEVMHRCQVMTKPTPLYTILTCKSEVDSWYDEEKRSNKKHFMASTGLLGIKERVKFIMPSDKSKFNLNREISENKPWVVVQDLRGDHFLTCTTVKDSKVIANVTCKIDPKNRELAHEHNKEIDVWLKQFFAELCVQNPINGHVTFRFVRDGVTGLILPLGAKVGVSLPYICYTSAHPRLLWRPCPHLRRNESMRMHEAVSNTLLHPGIEAVSKIIGNVLDKREALFAYWDPLPYCAYYRMQLPFQDVLEYTQRRERRLSASSSRSSH